MSHTRIVLTLILVATVAMLLGFVASTVVSRHLAPGRSNSRPEATEPHRPTGMVANV